MKKRILLILALFLNLTLSLTAAYFEFLPYTIKQPDGTTINCFVSGDEFFNWLHDQEGYTIIQDSDGYYYYGEQDGDLVKPSKYLVNSIIPGTKGLGKWIRISLKEYKRRKDEMFSYKKGDKGLPDNTPKSGTLNNIVVYIRFSDDTEFSTIRQSFDDKFNLNTGVALKSYYSEVSYNNLTITSTHYPSSAMSSNRSFQDSNPRKYYQPYNATTNPAGYNGDPEKTVREHALLVAAINYINSDSPVPTSLNIDGDNDNIVDNVCFIIRGSNGAWNDLLWAHRWALYSQTVYINGKRVYGYTFQPESQVAVKTLCHEMFHSLGAPDLYHYTAQGVISPAGTWDLMDNGGGHMLAYMKWKYTGNTWITSIPVVSGSGTYTLNPVTSPSNNCYKIVSPYSANEYFMVEYRNKTGSFESNIPGSGLIIYRIDTRYNGNSAGPPDEVYVYRPGGSLTANGLPGSAYFSSASGRTAINDATDPKSFLQDGSAGGLRISDVTAAGTTISFTVSLPDPPDTPAKIYVSNIFQTSFSARWNSVTNAGGYKLDLSTNAGFTSFVSGYNSKDLGNVVTAEITGLTPKTQYYCRVKAYNSGGTGLSSGTVSVKTLSTPSSVPAELIASSCNNLVTLSWRKSTGADFSRYVIYSQSPLSVLVRMDSTTNGISDTSKVLSGLTNGQTLFFRISSVNYDGAESSFSLPVTITVKTGVIPRIKSKWSDVLLCFNIGDSLKSYQWFSGTTAIPGASSQYYKTDKKPGSYFVQSVDLDGCRNSSLPLPSNILNPISAWPNPASVTIVLKLINESSGRTDITLFNGLGTKVLDIRTEKTENELLKEISVVNLPVGIYQVRVSVNNEVYSTQIVIAR
jgi:M6 family metalloprotease-like protein